MAAEPVDKLVTTPLAGSMVATAGEPLFQLPAGMASPSAVVPPVQIFSVPVIGDTGFTETEIDTVQPEGFV